MNLLGRRQGAISLVEVMVVLAMLGILASMAIPSFRQILITTRISVATSSLHSALNFVRAEAIKRGRPVTICRSTNVDMVLPSCASGNIDASINTGWGAGWIIFVDTNGNARFDPSDHLIQVQHPLFPRASEGSIVSTPHRNQLTYNPTGQLFATYLRFTVNRPIGDTDESHNRYLCIASGGRARVDKDGCLTR